MQLREFQTDIDCRPFRYFRARMIDSALNHLAPNWTSVLPITIYFLTAEFTFSSSSPPSLTSPFILSVHQITLNDRLTIIPIYLPTKFHQQWGLHVRLNPALFNRSILTMS